MRWFISLAAGPLALVGFFLPWAHGSGVLTGAEFTGYSLVRFTGDLQGLQLSLFEGAAVSGTRVAILLVPIAGAWQMLLTVRWRWHPGYAISGWYLAVFAVVAAIVGLVRGPSWPPLGVAMVLAAGIAFVVGTRAHGPGGPGPEDVDSRPQTHSQENGNGQA